MSSWAATLRRDAQRAKASASGALSRLIADNSERVLRLLRRFRPIIAVGPVRGRHPGRRRARGARRPRALHGRAIRAEDGGDHRAVHPRPRRHAAVPPRPRGAAAPRSAADDLPRLAEATLAAARERVAAADGQIDVVGASSPIRSSTRSSRATSGRPARTPRRSCAGRAACSRRSSSTSASAPPCATARSPDAGELRPHLDALIAARRRRDRGGRRRPRRRPDPAAAARTGRRRPPRHRDPPQPHRAHRRLDPDGLEGVRGRRRGAAAPPRRARGAQRAARAGDQRARRRRTCSRRCASGPRRGRCCASCAEDRTVAAGHRTARPTIPKGARVLVATQSAMFDERAVDGPAEFRATGRGATTCTSATGLHTCFGLEINRVHLPALAIALLEGPPVRRAPGDEGRMRWKRARTPRGSGCRSRRSGARGEQPDAHHLPAEPRQRVQPLPAAPLRRPASRAAARDALRRVLLADPRPHVPLPAALRRRAAPEHRAEDDRSLRAARRREATSSCRTPSIPPRIRQDWKVFHTDLNTATTIFAYYHLLPMREIMVRPLSEGAPRWQVAAVERAYPAFAGLIRLLLRPTDQRAAAALEHHQDRAGADRRAPRRRPPLPATGTCSRSPTWRSPSRRPRSPGRSSTAGRCHRSTRFRTASGRSWRICAPPLRAPTRCACTAATGRRPCASADEIPGRNLPNPDRSLSGV